MPGGDTVERPLGKLENAHHTRTGTAPQEDTAGCTHRRHSGKTVRPPGDRQLGKSPVRRLSVTSTHDDDKSAAGPPGAIRRRQLSPATRARQGQTWHAERR